MNIEIIYPEVKKKTIFLAHLRNALRWIFSTAIIACPIINLAVGGKAWSVVVIWAILGVWNLLVSPDTIEYSLIRQTVKAVLFLSVLGILIDRLLAPGWAGFVIPLLASAALLLTAIFFAIDIHTQKQNMMPMIWLILLALAFFIAAVIGWPELNWPMIVLGSVSSALTILGVVLFHKEIWLELKKRFHTQ